MPLFVPLAAWHGGAGAVVTGALFANNIAATCYMRKRPALGYDLVLLTKTHLSLCSVLS
jgi:hypothetical protein